MGWIAIKHIGLLLLIVIANIYVRADCQLNNSESRLNVESTGNVQVIALPLVTFSLRFNSDENRACRLICGFV